MWSVWLVFCDCGFHSVCPLMEKAKKLMDASWRERLTLVVSTSLPPYGLQSTARLLCSWDSPGKSTGEGCHALLQGIFPDPGIKPVSLMSPAWWADSLPPEPSRKSFYSWMIFHCVFYPLVDARLFSLLAIVNSAAVNTGVYVCAQVPAFSPKTPSPRSEIARSYGYSLFTI